MSLMPLLGKRAWVSAAEREYGAEWQAVLYPDDAAGTGKTAGEGEGA